MKSASFASYMYKANPRVGHPPKNSGVVHVRLIVDVVVECLTGESRCVGARHTLTTSSSLESDCVLKSTALTKKP